MKWYSQVVAQSWQILDSDHLIAFRKNVALTRLSYDGNNSNLPIHSSLALKRNVIRSSYTLKIYHAVPRHCHATSSTCRVSMLKLLPRNSANRFASCGSQDNTAEILMYCCILMIPSPITVHGKSPEVRCAYQQTTVQEQSDLMLL